MLNSTRSKWYDNESTVVLLLIIFFPIGLYGLWKNEYLSNRAKTLTTIVVATSVLVIGVQSRQDGRNRQAAGVRSSSQFPRTEPTFAPKLMPGKSYAASDLGINAVLDIPDGFKPVYKVLEVRDVSFKNPTTLSTVERKTVNISLPEGLDRATLELNMRRAAKEVYEKEKPDALMIYGYRRGESANTPYTVAMLTLAPYGDWGKAIERASPDSYKAVIEIRDTYLFKPASSGMTVILEYGGTAKTSVEIYKNSRDAFKDVNGIGELPNGTIAKVLDKGEYQLSPTERFPMYKITATYNGKTYTGWIFAENTKILSEAKQ